MWYIQTYAMSAGGGQFRENFYFENEDACRGAAGKMADALKATPMQQMTRKIVRDADLTFETLGGTVVLRPSMLVGFHWGSFDQARKLKEAQTEHDEIFKAPKVGFGT